MTRGVPQKMNEKLAFLGDASRHIVIFQKCVFLPPRKKQTRIFEKNIDMARGVPKKNKFFINFVGDASRHSPAAPHPPSPLSPPPPPTQPPRPPAPQRLDGSVALWLCGLVAPWLQTICCVFSERKANKRNQNTVIYWTWFPFRKQKKQKNV